MYLQRFISEPFTAFRDRIGWRQWLRSRFFDDGCSIDKLSFDRQCIFGFSQTSHPCVMQKVLATNLMQLMIFVTFFACYNIPSWELWSNIPLLFTKVLLNKMDFFRKEKLKVGYANIKYTTNGRFLKFFANQNSSIFFPVTSLIDSEVKERLAWTGAIRTMGGFGWKRELVGWLSKTGGKNFGSKKVMGVKLFFATHNIFGYICWICVYYIIYKYVYVFWILYLE